MHNTVRFLTAIGNDSLGAQAVPTHQLFDIHSQQPGLHQRQMVPQYGDQLWQKHTEPMLLRSRTQASLASTALPLNTALPSNPSSSPWSSQRDRKETIKENIRARHVCCPWKCHIICCCQLLALLTPNDYFAEN